MTYPVPANEKQRLRELYTYEIPDAEPAIGLTRICELASSLLDVPIAFVNFVDRDRVWVRASAGSDAREFTRADAFCSHTIMSDDPLVVNDLTVSPAFSDNPLVSGEPGVRFYAGVPLNVRAGLRIGTLCVVDTRPRALDARQVAALQSLGDLALEQVKLHRFKAVTRGEFKRRMISERALRRQGEQLTRSEALLARTARLARIGGWEYDLSKKALTWSDEALAIYGIPSGQTPDARTWLALHPRQGRRELLRLAKRAMRSGEPFDIELPFRTGSGAEGWIRVVGEAGTDDAGSRRLFGLLNDVTDAKHVQIRIAHLARHDALTGLPNRLPFEDHLAKALHAANAAGSLVAVVLLDVDGFREINDTLGHSCGDALIRGVAEKLRRAVRPTDFLARFGSDEFGLILTRLAHPDDVRSFAASLLAIFRDPVGLAQEDLYVSLSAGISVFPAAEEGSAGLLKDADIALSRAKALGGGRCHVFQPALREAAENRRQVLKEVRAGLGRDEFTVHYQPIVNLRDETISGFEALLRWHHPKRGIVTPGLFLPALEDAGLSVSLGEGVLARVLGDARRWLDEGLAFGRIGVNVAAAQFRGDDLADRIEALLAAYGVPASALIVEVTETVFLDRAVDSVGRALAQLRRLGVEIDFDDFGTGYASMTHLKQFAVDRLKVDQSFVRDITSDPDDAAIVSAVVNLGHSLGKTVVAEGVETEEQLDFISVAGCDCAQGYLFSRPMPGSEVPFFIEQWRLETTQPRTLAAG